ncbi:MAG TPA: GNAT family protein [Micavibrio sp.]|nr:GNAT family protein [Micavibrio sp.]
MIWGLRYRRAESPPAATLQSPRLILRPAVMGDYPQWKAVRQANYTYLKPFEPAWPDGCLTADFFARRLRRLWREWEGDRTYAFLIFLKDGTLIGALNVNNVTRGAANYASLGYWLDDGSQGQGYMTEAGFSVLDFAFEALRLSRMNAATLPLNRKSQAMLLRLGFSEEGFARKYIQIDGRRQDHILYGLDAADFSGAAGKAG